MKRGKVESTKEFIGIDRVLEHGIVTNKKEEIIYLLIKPCNISVMTEQSIRARIYGLMTVLKGVTELEMMCLSSRESFDENRAFLRRRLEEENNMAVRKLLMEDLASLDQMQSQMANSREFLLLFRPKEKTKAERELSIQRVEKMLSDQGFFVKLAEENDVKRILAVYYEQNVTTEKYEDYDGQRWMMERNYKYEG